MSYTTTDRHGDVKHVYRPGKPAGYEAGVWWPDFGNGAHEFSNQGKVHPTNTIFENVIERPKRTLQTGASQASSKDAQRPPAVGTATTPASPSQQFRRPAPQTEALFKSTFIPGHKSGGRQKPYGKGREGSWYEPRKVPQPSSNSGSEACFDTVTGIGTMGTPSSRYRHSRSLPSLPRTSAIILGTENTIRDSSSFKATTDDMPSWVAPYHPAIRLPDAAGRAGGPSLQFGAKRLP